MAEYDVAGTKVLLITGFAPVKLPQLSDMGIPIGPIQYLSSATGKDTLQFSIPTIGTAVLAASLVKHGIEVRVVDYYIDNLVDSLKAFDAEVAGISSTFMGIEDIQTIAREIRRRFPEVKIVMGGPLSWSLPPSSIMTAVPELDYIVLREGEQTFLALIRALKNTADVSRVGNLVMRRDGGIRQTALKTGQDDIGFIRPAWELMGIPSARRLPVLPVEASRGCPFNCAYCSEVTYWGKPVRYRGIPEVIDELKYDAQRLGIHTFRFTDSCFSAPPERCASLCDAIYHECVSQGIEVKWSSYARISNLDYALLEKMKRSGCVALDIGVESGSDRLLRLMGRNYTPESAISIAEAARELGIITNFNIVVGFPGETQDSIRATAALIERAAPDTYSCFLFFMAPNTRVDANHAQYMLEGQGLKWKHSTMTSEEAEAGIAGITSSITRSANFPGGEYFACYLASLGYTVAEIREFYRHINLLVKAPEQGMTPGMLTKVLDDINKYW